MLDDTTLNALFDRSAIADAARHRIRWIRENAPIRSVGGGTKNTVCRFCSRKMGFVLEAEAFNTEYAAFEEYDNDETVLEFYPQPCHLRINYINANNKKVHPDIVPDIFVVRRDRFTFVECKTEDDLHQLAREQPHRYTVDKNGNWRSPPAEIAAAELGCGFEVRSSIENNWIALENFEFFSDYLTADPSQLKISEYALHTIERRLLESAWVTVEDLLSDDKKIDADSIYSLIVKKKIYFDFSTNRISDPSKALIFRDAVTADAHRTFARVSVGLRTPSVAEFETTPGRFFNWDGKPWQIANVGEHTISVMPLFEDAASRLVELDLAFLKDLAHQGKIVPVAAEHENRTASAHYLLKKANTAQLQIANWRYEILFGTPGDDNILVNNKPRSIAYWLASFRAAEISYGFGYVGLLTNVNKTQGNHNRKCDPQAYALAIQAYETHWATDAQRSAALCHGYYRIDCESAGVTPISLRSFRKIIDSYRSHAQTKKRVGEKAAYNEEPPYLALEYTTPRHGNRPFHIGHIDHTPLPIKIRDESGEYTLQTVWLTLLIDAYSRYVLAFYLSFDPPSYRSCMMLVRECIRKHGRIPHWIVVDNGSDFQSIYFETLLAALQSHKKDRPKGKPKFGSVIERIFQTTNEQFISNLLGATHDMNPRLVGHDITPHAIWTIERLWVRLNAYFSDVYHNNVHTTLGKPPKVAFANGQEAFGRRSHKFYSYTQDFVILTCPSTPKGTAKVTPNGVKINYLYYRCSAMDFPGVLGTRIAVRYDPENHGTAYVYLQDKWQVCHSEYYAIFKNYTEKHIRMVSAYLRYKDKLTGQHSTINAQRLASFLDSSEAEELLSMQRILDSESNKIKQTINTPNDKQCDKEICAPEPSTASTISPHITHTLLEDF